MFRLYSLILINQYKFIIDCNYNKSFNIILFNEINVYIYSKK